jgi:uroporphyrinogen decarboxylase
MAASMTHRERVLAALNHQEPDRVPIDFGATRCSSIHVAGYERLKKYFGIEAENIITDRIMQPVQVDERILQALDIDTRFIALTPPDNSRDAQLEPTRWRDEWGIIRVQPEGSLYYDLEVSPLAGEITIQDIVNYPWPDPHDPGRTRNLRERVQKLRESTDCAIVFNMTGGFIHIAQYLRGFQEWFTDLILDPKLAGALMDAVLEVNMAIVKDALPLVSDLVDIVFTGDDIGHQNSPMVSPEIYRKLIKPRQERYFRQVKELTKAKVLYHTCGDVFPLVPDLIDLGIDAINPIQVTANEMDPARLKAAYGDKMAFWGGIDSHRVLPYGTPDDVRREVELRICQMGKCGGYVVNAVHNIQPDVPPENIVAMFEHAREFGKYPLTGC